jgi:anti-sigma factor RsiW
MSELTDRDALDDRMARFVLGELDERERADFEGAMASDPRMRADVDSLVRTLGLLPYAKLEPPPAGLRARLLAAAEGEAEAGAAAAGIYEAAGARRRWPWSGLAAAAASLAAVVTISHNHELRKQLALQDQASGLLQQPNVVLAFSLAGSEQSSPAFGRVVLDLDARKGAVVIHRLPPTRAGQVYRLWALVGGKSVLCGEFSPDPEGTVLQQIPVPVDAYTETVKKLVLTLEAGTPSTSPPLGPTVMIGT